MPKFSVSMMTNVEFIIDVIAETEDEAIDKAYEASPQQVCAQCSGWGKDDYQELILNSEFWEVVDTYERPDDDA